MGEKLQFTELDQYLFGQGTHYDIYKKLGAHPTMRGRKKGVYFAVWAPNARSVSVVGEFNEWDIQKNPMQKTGPIGVYETFIPEAKIGDLYKFYIIGYHGEEIYKADPYGNEAELRPGTASRIADISSYKWKDTTWMKHRPEFNEKKSPMAIYEVHPERFTFAEAPSILLIASVTAFTQCSQCIPEILRTFFPRTGLSSFLSGISRTTVPPPPPQHGLSPLKCLMEPFRANPSKTTTISTTIMSTIIRHLF